MLVRANQICTGTTGSSSVYFWILSVAALVFHSFADGVPADDGSTGGNDSPPQVAIPSYKICAEYVRRFNFQLNYSNADLFIYALCTERRKELDLWESTERPPLITGQNYPVSVVPSMTGSEYWVLPAWDYVVSNAVRITGTWDTEELRLLKALARPGDTFLDIGCHVGTYTVPLAMHVGPHGAVHSFEPFRLLFQLLNANVAINGLSNVFTHPFALGERVEMRRVRSPSLVKASNVGATRVVDQGPPQWSSANVHQYDGEEDVRIVTLDDFALDRVDILKVDVEGMLYPMLKGASKTIERHRPFLVVEHTGEAPPRLREAWDYLCTHVSKLHDLWCCAPSEKMEQVRQAAPVQWGRAPVTFARGVEQVESRGALNKDILSSGLLGDQATVLPEMDHATSIDQKQMPATQATTGEDIGKKAFSWLCLDCDGGQDTGTHPDSKSGAANEVHHSAGKNAGEQHGEAETLSPLILTPAGVSEISCVDKNNLCGAWATSGECEKNPKYMLKNCQKSCGGC
eukprot:gnl/MRDRNA2_/MRDRNA2_119513_c0_seq1.p1 gnl/MRDRNA2_/MRDRNA2_119513_c0~~gnl/MRDRNA2_/MRDRNA2_119513_c0_seq1.p1  ORF type:complete len:516 (+),score=70.46 gnl/MRDRNA2_/MRDRNA2_119513_c0_seq1:140-1687(+)